MNSGFAVSRTFPPVTLMDLKKDIQFIFPQESDDNFSY